MLPTTYQEHCQTFHNKLQQLLGQVTQANPDRATLQSTFLEVQQWFQQKMMSFNMAELKPTDEVRVRSFQTEINKQLRLLGMDMTFFQAARQAVTSQQRQAQMRDRIERLLSYCEALLCRTED